MRDDSMMTLPSCPMGVPTGSPNSRRLGATDRFKYLIYIRFNMPQPIIRVSTRTPGVLLLHLHLMGGFRR